MLNINRNAKNHKKLRRQLNANKASSFEDAVRGRFKGGENIMTAQKLTKPSESGKVNEYMTGIAHPLADVLEALRQIILKTDPQIGEEIKWNAPTFFYTGEMQPFNPKEYKRILIVSNLFRKDCIRLVFWGAAKVNDPSGFLEGDYTDGRRLALFYNLKDVESKEKLLRAVVTQQLTLLDK